MARFQLRPEIAVPAMALAVVAGTVIIVRVASRTVVWDKPNSELADLFGVPVLLAITAPAAINAALGWAATSYVHASRLTQCVLTAASGVCTTAVCGTFGLLLAAMSHFPKC